MRALQRFRIYVMALLEMIEARHMCAIHRPAGVM